MSNNDFERCSASSVIIREGITPHPPDWLKLKGWSIPRAGKAMKQPELSDIAGESVIWQTTSEICLVVSTKVESM